MIERVGAEDGARGLSATGADETSEAENLAVVSRRETSTNSMACGSLRVAPAGQALDLERDVPMLGDRTLAIERVDVAPDHHADDRLDMGFGDPAGPT